MCTAITAKDKSEDISDSWTVLVLHLQSKHESCSIHSITVSYIYQHFAHCKLKPCCSWQVAGSCCMLGFLWTCSYAPGPLLNPQMAWNSHLMQYCLARHAAGSNNRPTRSQHVTCKATNYFGQQEANQKETTMFKCINYRNTVVECRN